MSDIAPLSSNIAGRVTSSSPAAIEEQTTRSESRVSRGSDRVELSELARRLASSPQDIRADKVKAARERIDAGTLDTPQNLNAAIDSMLDDLQLGL